MSVRLEPEPKKASPETGFYLALPLGMSLIISSAVGGAFLPSNWGVVLVVVVTLIAFLLVHVIRTSRTRTVQARLDRENEGNEKRISHITQIENSYGVKFVPLSGAEVKAFPAQDVLVLFNGHNEPFDGRLYVVDGRATLKINDVNGFVSARDVTARLGRGEYYKAVKREEEETERANNQL